MSEEKPKYSRLCPECGHEMEHHRLSGFGDGYCFADDAKCTCRKKFFEITEDDLRAELDTLTAALKTARGLAEKHAKLGTRSDYALIVNTINYALAKVVTNDPHLD